METRTAKLVDFMTFSFESAFSGQFDGSKTASTGDLSSVSYERLAGCYSWPAKFFSGSAAGSVPALLQLAETVLDVVQHLLGVFPIRGRQRVLLPNQSIPQFQK